MTQIKLTFDNQMKSFKGTIPFPLRIENDPVEITDTTNKKPTFTFNVCLEQEITLLINSQEIKVERGSYAVTASGKQYNLDIHKKDHFTMVNISTPLFGDYAGVVFLTASPLTPVKRVGKFDFSIKVVSILAEEEDQIDQKNEPENNQQDEQDLLNYL